MFELRISSDAGRRPLFDQLSVTASAQPHGFWRNVGGSWQRLPITLKAGPSLCRQLHVFSAFEGTWVGAVLLAHADLELLNRLVPILLDALDPESHSRVGMAFGLASFAGRF